MQLVNLSKALCVTMATMPTSTHNTLDNESASNKEELENYKEENEQLTKKEGRKWYTH